MWHGFFLVWQNRLQSHPRRGRVRTVRGLWRISEFTGKSASGHRALALHAFASLAGGDAGGGSKDDLIDNEFGFLRVFFEIVGKCLSHGLVHSAGSFGVAELRLGLSLKLWFGDFDGDDGGQTFAEVFAGDFDLGFLKLLGCGLFGIFLQHSRHCHTEADEVGTAFDGVDVVDVGVEVLAVGGVIHNSHLDGNVVLLGADVDDIVEEVRA